MRRRYLPSTLAQGGGPSRARPFFISIAPWKNAPDLQSLYVLLSVRGSEQKTPYLADTWAWYNQVLENPRVQVTLDGEKGDYLAVVVSDEEHRRVDGEHSLGIGIRILTGFPPRYFVWLDPR